MSELGGIAMKYIIDCPTRIAKTVLNVMGKKVSLWEKEAYASDTTLTRLVIETELDEVVLERRLFGSKRLAKSLSYYDTLNLISCPNWRE